MDRIQIRGGAKLQGSIPISGAKNAALPLMIASLLTDQTLTLENLPRLADVGQLVRILGNHGVDYSVDGKRAGEGATAGHEAQVADQALIEDGVDGVALVAGTVRVAPHLSQGGGVDGCAGHVLDRTQTDRAAIGRGGPASPVAGGPGTLATRRPVHPRSSAPGRPLTTRRGESRPVVRASPDLAAAPWLQPGPTRGFVGADDAVVALGPEEA